MPNTKISELPAVVGASGTDEIHVNQSGVSKKVAVSQLSGLISQISVLGSPSVNTQQEYINSVGSAGYFGGGIISDAGSGSINISAGSGFIRTTPTQTDPLLSFEWPAFTGIPIPTDTYRYIYISYNSGSPTYVLSASEFDESADNIILGVAVNESNTIISAENFGVRLEESIGQAGRFIRRVLSVSRDIRRGGLILGQTGTRFVTMTPGHIWFGRTDYTIPSFNSSVSDKFDIYYRSVGGFTKIALAAQWPNTQYDDGTGTLATLIANKWGVLWFYIETDGHLVMVFGRGSYTTQAAAEQELAPSSLPPRLVAMGILASRFIFQKSASTAIISSTFDTKFVAAGVTKHSDLSGLTDPDHPSTALAMSTSNVIVGRSSSGAGPSQEIPCVAAGRAIIATSDAAIVRAKALASNLFLGGSTAEKVTGLDMVVGIGTWTFNYYVRYRSSSTINGIKSSVNHSGTLSSFVANMRWACNSSSDANDQPKQNSNINPVIMSTLSARAKSINGWGPLGGVDTANADMLLIIEGIMTVDVSGDIQLYCGSEINNPSEVEIMGGSSLVLTKIA